MRTIVPERLEHGRVLRGKMASKPKDGMMGMFNLIGNLGRELVIVSSGQDSVYGWEHVSVSLPNRTPSWPEMCWVKDLFWLEDECVIQYHPPKSDYVNCHPYCLHLWKPINQIIPMPPSVLVGPSAKAAAD